MNEKPGEAAVILSDFLGDISAEDIEEQIKSGPPRVEVSENAYNKAADIMYNMGWLSNKPRQFSELPNYNRIPKTK
jgi:hypothetical protein